MSSLRNVYGKILEIFPPIEGTNDASGWGDYVDTTYNVDSQQTILANTDTVLVNNRGAGLRTQVPEGVEFVNSSGKITGRFAEGIFITVEFIITPVLIGTTLCEVWLNIGGDVGQLYRRPFSFPRGAGIPRSINFTVGGFTYDTWTANGADVRVRTNGTATVYGTRFLIQRGHIPYNL